MNTQNWRKISLEVKAQMPSISYAIFGLQNETHTKMYMNILFLEGLKNTF